MSPPLVDILLPVRDAQATLRGALESIRRQTFTDFRCFILDDGSRDESPRIAARLCDSDPRFGLRRLPRRGIVATLNAGLALCGARFLARMDADDLMEPKRLERQLDLMTRDERVDVVSSRVRFFGERVSRNLLAYESWLNETLTHQEILRDLFVESPLPHPTVMLRASCLDEVGEYRDVGYPEDYDLWLRGSQRGWTFAKCREVLVHIREHAKRLTKTDERYAARAFLECKAEHLVEAWDLAGRDVILWGAGRDGKRTAKALRRRGVTIRCFVDIAPTKIGRRILGVEVRSFENLREKPGCLIVVAVGIKGARSEIRRALSRWNYREREEFVCVG